eukprot:6667455-Prymnesium_polylepis.1
MEVAWRCAARDAAAVCGLSVWAKCGLAAARAYIEHQGQAEEGWSAHPAGRGRGAPRAANERTAS